VGSLCFLLYGFYFTKRKYFFLSSLFCGFSVLFRQTNIIWTFWIAAESLLEDFESSKNLKEFFSFGNIQKLILNYFSFLIVGISFVLFVIWNKGIVVGDKTNHIAILHVNQVFYFAVFSCVFTPLNSLVTLINKKSELIQLKNLFFIPIIAIIAFKFKYLIHNYSDPSATSTSSC
jgi:alpha-1,2-glucosyltransferase